MASYPLDIRRCRHIRTNGTQCGSPALKSKELCFYHDQNRPVAAELYIDGERYSDGSIMLPPLEDAHSIQTVIHHVVQLMLTRRIDRKDAGVLLYALQIASCNLKTMQTEKPKPTQMVVEPEKAADTPLGMTPWSATGQGHDPEEGEEAEEEPVAPEPQPDPLDTLSPEELCKLITWEERKTLMRRWQERGWITDREVDEYVLGGPDPILRRIYQGQTERQQRAAERAAASAASKSENSEPANSQAPAPNSETPPPNSEASTDPNLPPGTIQACQASSATMGSR